jgi:hypothetical protein
VADGGQTIAAISEEAQGRVIPAASACHEGEQTMKLSDITAKWATLSTRGKWATAGAAFVAIGVMSAGQEQDAGNYAQGGPANVEGGYAQNGLAQGAVGQPQAGYPQGGYPQGGYPQGSYAAGGYAGGGAGDSGSNMAAWEAQQRSQSQSAAAFGQMISDTDTIRSNDTGQVYSGVDGAAAGVAVDSGAYTSVPTSELPVAGE